MLFPREYFCSSFLEQLKSMKTRISGQVHSSFTLILRYTILEIAFGKEQLVCGHLVRFIGLHYALHYRKKSSNFSDQ
jgi:hypothetical protein